MKALCVEDEILPLESLLRQAKRSPDISEVTGFSDELEALAWAEDNRVDVAFLDIELHEMNGLELAERLIALHPDCSIVFCTSYEQYAVPAIKLHRDVGYLLKPFSYAQLQEEIDHVKEKRRASGIQAVCFGNFDVFVKGQPVSFHRKKSKELLAYLIDRRGAMVTSNELCAVLWEGEEDGARRRDYLYHLVSDIKSTLAQAGASEVFLIMSQGYAVDTDRVDCDYYRFLAGDEAAFKRYTGEYMYQYSWAEPTNAWIAKQADKQIAEQGAERS